MPICKKCHNEFPNRIKIDGKVRVLNSRKFCLSCSPWGNHNTKNLIKKPKTQQPMCSICKKIIPQDQLRIRHDRPGQYHSWCKSCAVKKQYERQLHLKQMAVDYLGGECVRCGYNKCNAALHFHHLDPNEKDIGIAKLHTYSFAKMKLELDKCILLCANCHAEEHYMT